MVSEYTYTFYIQPANINDDKDTADGEFWVRDANDGELLANNSGPWSLNHSEDITIDIDSHPWIEFEIEAQSSSPGSIDFDWAFFSDETGSFTQITADDSELPITEVGVLDYRPPILSIDSVSSTAGEVDLSWSHPTDETFDVLWSPESQYVDGSPDESDSYTTIISSTSSTTAVHDSPENGNNYYAVQAVENGRSLLSNEEVAQILGTPSGVSQTVTGDDQIDVSWNYDGDANFAVEVSEQGGAYEAVTTTASTSITYSATPSTNSHRFRVRAESAGDEGGWAYTETVDTDPSNLSVTTVASREIGLAWDGIRDANDYEILRAESTGSNPLDYSPVGTTGGLTTFTDTSLEDGERYYYRVRAVYPGTDSQPTNEVDATTPLPTPALDALDTATAREIVVEYTLTDNSSDGDLTIERSDDGGSTWTTVTTVTNLSTTEYTDSGLLDGMEYAYRLTRETDHASVQSGTLSATTILPAPTDLEVVDVRDDAADVQFRDTANNKQGYRVFAGPDGYLEFDASQSQYVEIPDVLPLSDSITVSAFVELGATQESYFLKNYGGSGSEQHFLLGAGPGVPSSSIAFVVDDGGESLSASATYDEGTLYHVTGVFDTDDNEVRLYIDGELVDTTSVDSDFRPDWTERKTRLGASNEGENHPLEGEMHGATVHDRALSNNEIEKLSDGEVSSDELVAYWLFNQGAGDKLTDYSGNGNDGTLQNDPTWVGGEPLEQNDEDIDPQYRLDYTNGYTAAQVDVPATRDGITIVARFTTDTETDDDQALVDADQHLIQIENLASGEGQYRAWPNTSGPANKAIPPNGLSAGETYEVVWTYDYGTDVGDFYHNAENIDTDTYGHLDEINPIDEIETGTWSSGKRKLMGGMDRVLMYDRKLTNSEVSDIYNGDAPEAGKIIEYDYTGGPGNTALTDRSSNGWDGQFVNTPEWSAPLSPITHTLSDLRNGEAYVTRASVFTDDVEAFDI